MYHTPENVLNGFIFFLFQKLNSRLAPFFRRVAITLTSIPSQQVVVVKGGVGGRGAGGLGARIGW